MKWYQEERQLLIKEMKNFMNFYHEITLHASIHTYEKILPIPLLYRVAPDDMQLIHWTKTISKEKLPISTDVSLRWWMI